MPNTFVSNVFSNKYDYLKGKEAWRSNLRLITTSTDRIRSSLGPNGAYKMITYNRGPEKIVKITRDAVSVLEELAIQYPTLAVFSEAAKLHREQFGDGTKSFLVLTTALLKKADELTSKRIHPMVILNGYRKAAEEALKIMSANTREADSDQLETLMDVVDCGSDCLTLKIRKMIVEASRIARRDDRFDRDRIRIIRKPGGIQSETRLIKGLVLKKSKLHPNMPDYLKKPIIAITSERIGTNRLEVKMRGQGPFHMKFDIATPENLGDYRDTENQRKSEALKKLGEAGVTVLFSQQPVDEFSKSKLMQMGILAFETVVRDDLVLISNATGASIIGDLRELKESDVGRAGGLETEKIGLERIVSLTECDFATFLIRGSTVQALDELELLIKNSLRLLETASLSSRTVAGGGATELEVARQLEEFALQFSDREQLAVKGFSEALLELPRSLAANNGLNADDSLLQLRKLHAEGHSEAGLCLDGSYGRACSELLEIKNAVLRRAFETTTLMLRIDEQVIGKEIPKFHKK